MCTEDEPELDAAPPGQVAACHFPLEDRAIMATAATLAEDDRSEPVHSWTVVLNDFVLVVHILSLRCS